MQPSFYTLLKLCTQFFPDLFRINYLFRLEDSLAALFSEDVLVSERKGSQCLLPPHENLQYQEYNMCATNQPDSNKKRNVIVNQTEWNRIAFNNEAKLPLLFT